MSVVETHGQSFAKPGLIEAELVVASMTAMASQDVFEVTLPEQLELAMNIARKKNLAAIFLNGENIHCYDQVTNDIANQLALGTNKYLITLEGVVCHLNSYKTHLARQ